MKLIIRAIRRWGFIPTVGHILERAGVIEPPRSRKRIIYRGVLTRVDVAIRKRNEAASG